jgi:hypothetical protein
MAAYSYMALIPLIQPPIMKLLTTKNRKIKMEQTREVSKTEKIVFPIIVTIFVILLLPSTAPLIGCLMLGNLFRECGVTERLSDTAQNELMNIVTIFLGLRRATTVASNFLTPQTLKIVFLGLVAFGHLHRRRRAAGKSCACCPQGKGQPADRLRRRLRRADGRARLPGGRPEGEPRQLPADARHGPQRGRRHRLRHRRRLPARRVRPAVNGFTVVGSLLQNVEAGETVTMQLVMDNDELSGIGIKQIAQMSLTLYIDNLEENTQLAYTPILSFSLPGVSAPRSFRTGGYGPRRSGRRAGLLARLPSGGRRPVHLPADRK